MSQQFLATIGHSGLVRLHSALTLQVEVWWGAAYRDFQRDSLDKPLQVGELNKGIFGIWRLLQTSADSCSLLQTLATIKHGLLLSCNLESEGPIYISKLIFWIRRLYYPIFSCNSNFQTFISRNKNESCNHFYELY